MDPGRVESEIIQYYPLLNGVTVDMFVLIQPQITSNDPFKLYLQIIIDLMAAL